MKYLEELLFLQSLPGLGKAAVYRDYMDLLPKTEGIDDLAGMLGMDVSSAAHVKESVKKQTDDLLSRRNLTVITALDDEYPVFLSALGRKKPLVLYVLGDASLLLSPGIAVAGTRNPSAHTRRIEPGLIRNLIGFTGEPIVSGLAAGCDAIAHEAAMNFHGKTVAVLPSGFDRIFPAENRGLAERIAEGGGCLISEYLPCRQAQKYTFIERDGLIAAFSHTVFAVECGMASGTMETVKAAKNMKRKLRCYMPGDMELGDFTGNEYMVREMGAVAVRNTAGLKTVLEGIPGMEQSIPGRSSAAERPDRGREGHH